MAKTTAVLGVNGNGAHAGVVAGAGILRWQHAWISVNPNERADVVALEQMGNDGWELVSAVPWSRDTLMMFFKRPRA